MSERGLLMINKLTVPSFPVPLARPRLYGMLDAACERPVVWIGAPAGAGKSTLTASYLAERKPGVIWYAVDSRDRDPTSLFYHLGVAVEALALERSLRLPLLGSDHPAQATGFARRYFDALFAQIPRPFVLVFDDCHLLASDDRWFELMREACLCAPAGVSLFFLSRHEPPPVFARLRASSRVATLGWDELRFQGEEASDLIERHAARLGVALQPAQVEHLAALHDGWGAGIVLSLECASAHHFEARPELAAGSQELFDYFATEVYREVEPELRRNLARSAVLPVMSASLLERLFGNPEQARALIGQRRPGLFIEEYPSSPPTYRYHPLFREFLLTRLMAELGAEELAELRHLAARALGEAGEIEASVELSLSSDSGAAAASMLTDAAPRLLAQGRASTLAALAERLPRGVLLTRPLLCYFAGVASMGSNLSQAVELTRHAFDAARDGTDDAAFWMSWNAHLSAVVFESSDYSMIPGLLELGDGAAAQRSFPSQHGQQSFVRARALALSASAPEVPSTRAAVEAALAGPLGRDVAELALAFCYYGFRGELSRLREIADDWQRRALRDELGPIERLSLTFAEVVYNLLSGERERCASLIRQGLEIAERTGVFTLNGAFLTYGAFAHAMIEDQASLSLTVDELGDVALGDDALERARYRFALGLEALLREDLSRARRCLADADAAMRKCRAPFGMVVHRLPYIELLLRAGEIEDASELLEGERARCEALGFVVVQSYQLLAAELAFLQGDAGTGDERLAAALAIGETSGSVPLPSPSRRLLEKHLRRARERGIAATQVRRLTDVFALAIDAPGSSSTRERAAPAVPDAFLRAVRRALRRLHETQHLKESVLLNAAFLNERVAAEVAASERIDTLRDILREEVERLAASARTELAYRALYYTYLEPAPTQLLAAESARMSFGSYRRHLAAGLGEVSTVLWLREQALGVP